jgi:hypothetical protein
LIVGSHDHSDSQSKQRHWQQRAEFHGPSPVHVK